MTASDLKLRIFRQIDSLEKEKLEELHGILLNYLNGQQEITDWDSLSIDQKTGLYDAIRELKAGKGVPNQVVLENIEFKYRNE